MSKKQFTFSKAEKHQLYLMMAIHGPSGSGKTYTALQVATGLIPGGRVAVIDSENKSALLYAPLPGEKADPTKGTFDFEHLPLDSTDPQEYIAAMQAAAMQGFDMVITDGISPAWEWLVAESDRIASRSMSKNTFQAWAKVTPMYQNLVKEIRKVPIHKIVTMRTKTEWVMEEVTRSDGRKGVAPKRVGLAPVFRQGGEYEFDVVGVLDTENSFSVEKTRLVALQGQIIERPGQELGKLLGDWLNAGAPIAEEPEAEPETAEQDEQGDDDAPPPPVEEPTTEQATVAHDAAAAEQNGSRGPGRPAGSKNKPKETAPTAPPATTAQTAPPAKTATTTAKPTNGNGGKGGPAQYILSIKHATVQGKTLEQIGEKMLRLILEKSQTATDQDRAMIEEYLGAEK